MSTWQVQVKNDRGQWTDKHVGSRCSTALGVWTETPKPKRFLRNGRVIPMRTMSDQLDLFSDDKEGIR